MGMSDEDRQAWRDMAGPEFQTWLQQEMGIALARLNMRDFMETTRSELEKLKDGQIDQKDWFDIVEGLAKVNVRTMEMLTEIRGSVQRLSDQVGGLAFNVRELEARLNGEAIGTATLPPPPPPEPEKVRGPKLTPKQHKVLEYIVAHPKCSQSAMVFHLEISKTTLSEILSNLFDMDLIARDRVSTNNGGHTFIYTSVNDLVPMLPPDAVPPAPIGKTTIGQITDYLRENPWKSAKEIHEGVHWLGPVPPVNTVAAALSNGVKDGKFGVVHNSQGGRSCYALSGARPLHEPSEAEINYVSGSKDRAQATRDLLVLNKPLAPVPPKLNLFEQIVVKTIRKFKEPLSPQEISDLARQHDLGDIQVNSVRSVCGRLLGRGILETVQGRDAVRYQMKA
jgi:hypothetical protein